MDNLLLHSHTKAQLLSFATSGNHALLLTGAIGSGLTTTSKALARQLLTTDSLESHPYYNFVEPAGKALSIEQVREVQTLLTLKTTGKNTIRRVIILCKADTMTDEAQNALLKSLEEPPADTVLILTATRPQNIKQTIHSRLQSITIQRVALDTARQYFSTDYSEKQISWAHALSDGQVGLMKALLENEQDHPVASQIAAAKQLYGMTSFDRLVQIDRLAKDKDTLPELLYACKRICTGALESAAKKGQTKSLEQWYRQLAVVSTAEEQLRYNPNTKLFLTNLFMQM